MNRTITLLNFLGVLALVALCARQWSTNDRLKQRADSLGAQNHAQADQLTAKDKAIQQDQSDEADLRQRLSISEASAQAMRDKLAATTAERDRIASERVQLRAALDKWIAAVSARDAAIRQASGEIQTLSTQRNDAIVKFNQLVDKYNQLAKVSDNGH